MTQLDRIRKRIEALAPDCIQFWEKLLAQIGFHQDDLTETLWEEVLAAQTAATPLKGRTVATKMRSEVSGFYTGQDTFEPLMHFFARTFWRLNLIPAHDLHHADPWRTLDITGDLNAAPDAIDKNLVTQPVVNITDKLAETRFARGFPPTAALSDLGLDRFSPDAVPAFDAFFGRDNWIIKTYGPDSYAGAGTSVLAAEQVKSLLATHGSIPQQDRPDWMVQQRIPVLHQSPEDRRDGRLIQHGSEARVHVVTTQHGDAKVVPYATWWKGDWIPQCIRTPNTSLIEQAALDAVASLPPEDRTGSTFGVDVVLAEDGTARIIELNPTKPGGLISGYLVSNPFVQDAFICALHGRLPIHAKLARHLLAIKAREQAQALGVNKYLKGTPWRTHLLRHAQRTANIRSALQQHFGPDNDADVYSPYGNSFVTGIRIGDRIIPQESPEYAQLPQHLRDQLDEYIWLSKEIHDAQIHQEGRALFSRRAPSPNHTTIPNSAIPTPDDPLFEEWVEEQPDCVAIVKPPAPPANMQFASVVSRHPSRPDYFRLTYFYRILDPDSPLSNESSLNQWVPTGHQLFRTKREVFGALFPFSPSHYFTRPAFSLASHPQPTSPITSHHPSTHDVVPLLTRMVHAAQDLDCPNVPSVLLMLLRDFSPADHARALAASPEAFPDGLTSLAQALCTAVISPTLPPTEPVPDLPPPSLADFAKAFAAKIAPQVPLVLCKSPEDWPPAVALQTAEEGVPPNQIQGFCFGNAVYLNMAAITDADQARRVILHEIVGHVGLASVLPTTDTYRLFRLFADALPNDPTYQAARQRVIETYLNGQHPRAASWEQQQLFVNEMFAAICESHPLAEPASPLQSLAQSAFLLLRQGLAAIGLADPDDVFLQRIVLRSRLAAARTMRHSTRHPFRYVPTATPLEGHAHRSYSAPPSSTMPACDPQQETLDDAPLTVDLEL